LLPKKHPHSLFLTRITRQKAGMCNKLGGLCGRGPPFCNLYYVLRCVFPDARDVPSWFREAYPATCDGTAPADVPSFERWYATWKKDKEDDFVLVTQAMASMKLEDHTVWELVEKVNDLRIE